MCSARRALTATLTIQVSKSAGHYCGGGEQSLPGRYTHTEMCTHTHIHMCLKRLSNYSCKSSALCMKPCNQQGNNICERYRVEIYHYPVWSNMRDLCTLVWVTLNNLALDHWPQADNTASVSLKQSRPASSSAFNKLWRWIVMILSTGCFPPSLDQPGPVRSRLARRGTAHSDKSFRPPLKCRLT